jgi:hypothetical protein
LNIDPQVFANVVEAMHTLAQQQPQITSDVALTKQAIIELGTNMAGLMEDIRSIAQAVGVRPGPLVLGQGQVQAPQQFAPPQGQQHATGRPSREQLAQTLRSIPGVNEQDKIAG